MIRHPLGSNRTVTLFPYSTLFRPSAPFGARSEPRDRTDAPDLGRARFWADAGVGRFSVLFASTGVGRSYGRWPASWWDVARRGPGCAAGRSRRFSVLYCSMRIEIDGDRCTGPGRCYSLAPDVFDRRTEEGRVGKEGGRRGKV